MASKTSALLLIALLFVLLAVSAHTFEDGLNALSFEQDSTVLDTSIPTFDDELLLDDNTNTDEPEQVVSLDTMEPQDIEELTPVLEYPEESFDDATPLDSPIEQELSLDSAVVEDFSQQEDAPLEEEEEEAATLEDAPVSEDVETLEEHVEYAENLLQDASLDTLSLDSDVLEGTTTLSENTEDEEEQQQEEEQEEGDESEEGDETSVEEFEDTDEDLAETLANQNNAAFDAAASGSSPGSRRSVALIVVVATTTIAFPLLCFAFGGLIVAAVVIHKKKSKTNDVHQILWDEPSE